ncbi:translation elongation factor 1B beta subunit [Strongylocentrotus purpuratus]|uniref:Elongation factor 1-beta n=1 Tax=Strongylocentrotus purpuratus TaxID=7668 RepID=A0A7M6UEP6_STRPU|nr:eukaryotic translation elongation factor 1 beta 2 [Strongylocentrotus purpuratus]|eukprot:NP_001118232.1 translation elongation factor 1B beta subunit [Strongylocentrotus purpuratus]
MGFGDLKKSGGQAALNDFLSDRSYIEGYTASQADVVIFKAMSGAPAAELFNALRWYNQVKSYSSTFTSLPGVAKALGDYGPAGTPAAAKKPAGDDDDDDDDFDCFGSDEEEEAKPAPKTKIEVKKPKKVVIAKSSVLFDVKPEDDETDLGDIEKAVRAIVKDGLHWGASKRVPICYGIEKLQVLCTVEDEKVSVDALQEEIEEFDTVQSVDIAAFNKV